MISTVTTINNVQGTQTRGMQPPIIQFFFFTIFNLHVGLNTLNNFFVLRTKKHDKDEEDSSDRDGQDIF